MPKYGRDVLEVGPRAAQELRKGPPQVVPSPVRLLASTRGKREGPKRTALLPKLKENTHGARRVLVDQIEQGSLPIGHDGDHAIAPRVIGLRPVKTLHKRKDLGEREPALSR
ncbi:MAG: hypothetical protein Q8Q09_20605 [Deltaproteobacteria bacterium]|nr:hypothetical protein [Deltaproteobacteria bacterium]